MDTDFEEDFLSGVDGPEFEMIKSDGEDMG